VRLVELLLQFVQVGEGELPWIRLLRNSKVYDVIGYVVAVDERPLDVSERKEEV
jgi:hypothetical protein